MICVLLWQGVYMPTKGYISFSSIVVLQKEMLK